VITDAGSTITSGALPLAILVAVAAGFISFASPCVLPLVPGFLGYVTGLSGVTLEQRSRGRLVLGAGLFVLGFTAVFIGVAVTVSAAGTLLREHQSALMRFGGIIVILMALVFLGVGSQRRFAPRWKPAAGLAGAPLLGMVFGLGNMRSPVVSGSRLRTRQAWACPLCSLPAATPVPVGRRAGCESTTAASRSSAGPCCWSSGSCS